MSLNPFADGLNNNYSTFIVKNNNTRKTVKVMGVNIAPGNSYNLMSLEGVTESDIKVSLLKGVLKRKLALGEISITSTDIDLSTLNNSQLSFLNTNLIGRGTLPSGGLYKTIYPKNDGTDDFSLLNAEMILAAYKYALYLSPVDKNGNLASFNCMTPGIVPSGTTLIGESGTKIISTLTPTGGPGGFTQSVFYSNASTVGTDTTLSSNTITGSLTISSTLSKQIGALIVVGRGLDNIFQQFIVKNVVGSGPYTLTLNEPIQWDIASGAGSVVGERVVPQDINIFGNGMTISGTGDRAIEIGFGKRVHIYDVNVTATNGSFTAAGISLDVGSVDSTIERCTVDGGSTTYFPFGLESGVRVAAIDCSAQNATTSVGATGFYFGASREASAIRCQASNGYIGFLIGGGGGTDSNGSQRVTIDFCHAINNSTDGIVINDGSKNVYINNSTSIKNGSHGLYCYIVTSSPSNVFVTNSSFLSNTGSGIRAANDSQVYLENCASESNTVSNILASTTAKVFADGCVFTGGAPNIDLLNSARLYLTNCKLKDSTVSYIRQRNSSRAEVTNCEVYDSTLGANTICFDLDGTPELDSVNNYFEISNANFVSCIATGTSTSGGVARIFNNTFNRTSGTSGVAVYCVSNSLIYIKQSKTVGAWANGCYSVDANCKIWTDQTVDMSSSSTKFGVGVAGGYNFGTVVLNGVTPVAVPMTGIKSTDIPFFVTTTAGGTPDGYYVIVVTAGTGFTVASKASNTSTLSWRVI